MQFLMTTWRKWEWCRVRVSIDLRCSSAVTKQSVPVCATASNFSIIGENYKQWRKVERKKGHKGHTVVNISTLPPPNVFCRCFGTPTTKSTSPWSQTSRANCFYWIITNTYLVLTMGQALFPKWIMFYSVNYLYFRRRYFCCWWFSITGVNLSFMFTKKIHIHLLNYLWVRHRM